MPFHDYYNSSNRELFGDMAIVSQYGFDTDGRIDGGTYNITIVCMTPEQFEDLCKTLRSWGNRHLVLHEMYDGVSV